MYFFVHTKKNSPMIPRLIFLTMKAIKRLPRNSRRFACSNRSLLLNAIDFVALPNFLPLSPASGKIIVNCKWFGRP